MLARSLPNLAALITLLANAWTVDEYERLIHREPTSYHLAVAIVHAVLAWAVVRGLLWIAGR